MSKLRRRFGINKLLQKTSNQLIVEIKKGDKYPEYMGN